ncbi:MAG TPA: hypothetical protein VFG63_06215 [Nocardioidaceae bacterium]|nr:hypothetical protein [Nocardioidaceae bacterium]
MSAFMRPGLRSRSALVALLAALGLVLAALSPVAATASPRAKTPPASVSATATQIVVTSVAMPGVTVPDTPGTPTFFVVKDQDLDVAVSFVDSQGAPAPLSTNKDVDVVLTVAGLPGTPPELGTVTVPANATAATFTAVRIPTATNGVELDVASQPKKPSDAIFGTSPSFDVLRDFVGASTANTLTSIGTGGGVSTSCDATPDEPVCADLLLPDRSRVTSDSLLLSLGECDQVITCSAGGSVVQVLVGLTSGSTTPAATLVMKCDKSLCGGGGVPSFDLFVDLTYDADPTTTAAPPCPDKGVLGADQAFCVDYVQSTRSNAGDLVMYLLFNQDARVRFP